MPYSAGTIFLQVVPSYDGFQDANRDMAKGLAKSLEQGLDEGAEKGAKKASAKISKILNEETGKNADEAGGEAAEKYAGAYRSRLEKAIKSMERELAPIELRTGSSKAIDDLDKVKKALNDLSKIKIEPGMDTRSLEKQTTEALKLIDGLNEHATIDVKYDFKAGRRQLESFNKEIQAMHPVVEVEAKFEGKTAERNLGAFERKLKDRLTKAMGALGDGADIEIAKLRKKLDALNDQDIGLDISADDALRELRRVEVELAHIAATTTNIRVHADVSAALAELSTLEKAKKKAAESVTTRVNRGKGGAAAAFTPEEISNMKKGNKELGLLGNLMSKLKLDGRDAANSFRFFNVAILAVSLTGAGLVPILSAMAGGLLAVSVAALGVGAGLAVLFAGFSGIGTAVGALNDAQDNSAKETQANAKKMRNALESVQDAERSLKRAREDAADSAQAAEQQVLDAKEAASRGIEQAIDRQVDAQRNLTDANKDALRAQQDLIEARRQAQRDLDDIAARQKRNALDERQGVIDLFNATVENNAAQNDPGATNLEREQASINLEQAKLRLEEIRKAEKDLAAERKKGVNGSERVKTAEDNVTRALEAQKEATRALADANKDLARARSDGARQVSDAIKAQTRTIEDGQESISDAQRNLVRSQQDYRDALKETGEIGSSSMQKVQEAMGKLSPAGRAFALFLHGLRDEWFELRSAIQEGLLPGVQSGLTRIINTYGAGFTRFVGTMAKVLGDLADEASRLFVSPAWKSFFQTMEDLSPKVTQDFGRALLNWMTVFAVLAEAVAPFALMLSQALLEISERVLAWVQSKPGQDAIASFFDYVMQVAPLVKEFFKQLGLALLKVVEALAMFGPDVLIVLTKILEWVAGLDPQTIAYIAGGLLLMVGAFQALSGFVALFSVIFSPLGAYVLLILGAVAAMVYLYKTNENFRDLVQKAWPIIKEVTELALKAFLFSLNATWDGIAFVIDIFETLGRVTRRIWDDTLHPIFSAIGSLFSKIAGDIWFVWTKILWPVFKAIGSIVFQLWWVTMKPIFKAIGETFTTLANGMKWVFDHTLGPLFSAIADKLGIDLNGKEKGGGLVGAFRSAVSLITSIWDGIGKMAKKPIDFLVGTVINKGVIGSFNALAGHLPGLKTVDPIKWPPPGFARGGIADDRIFGVRPGYMPGRDNQLIAVGGGEGILRPELTKALGPDWINAANKRARLYGVQGAANFLGGFSNGGIAGSSGTRDRGAALGDWDKARYKGHTFNLRTIRMLQAAERLAGQVIRITQGSYSTSVAASGSTHAGGGAFDAGWPGGGLGATLVSALRMVGFAAWHRDPGQGPWPHHIHGIAAGDPTASASAQRQVQDYYRGGNGLGGRDDGPNVPKDKSLLDKAKSGLGGILGWVSDAISNPIDWLKGKISGQLEKLTKDWGDNTLTKTLKAIPEAIINGMGQMISGAMDFVGGGGDSDPAGVKGMVQQMAASVFGWSGGQWGALERLVQKESSWNPNAQNPSSTAFGLFQFLNGTWGPYGPKTDDPRLQAQYGMQYIKDRYGDPEHALAFHNSHNWYSDGGVVPDNGTMMYDNGGYLPPGVTRVVNLTGKPEPVFTEGQFDSLQGGKGAGVHYEPHFYDSDLTAGDVAEDLNFTLTRLDQGVLKP